MQSQEPSDCDQPIKPRSVTIFAIDDNGQQTGSATTSKIDVGGKLLAMRIDKQSGQTFDLAEQNHPPSRLALRRGVFSKGYANV